MQGRRRRLHQADDRCRARQDLGAFGGAQREPALVEQNDQADRLGDDQGGQQQSDQLSGQAPRPERPQEPPQPSHVAFDVGCETVAAAPVRLDQGRLLRVALDLAPQPADLVVDAAVEHVGGAPAGQIEQLVAAQHHARMVEERAEQQEFHRAERHRHAIRIDQLALRRIQGPAIEADPAALQRHPLPGHAVGAPQHRLDARDQLARVERFDHVVVGAHLQADHAIGILGHRGQHDHRQLRVRPQMPAQRQPVLAGHHDVEHDQIDPARLEQPARLGRALGRADPKAMLGEIPRQEIADLAVVVDHQDVGEGLHRLAIRLVRAKYDAATDMYRGKFVTNCVGPATLPRFLTLPAWSGELLPASLGQLGAVGKHRRTACAGHFVPIVLERRCAGRQVPASRGLGRAFLT